MNDVPRDTGRGCSFTPRCSKRDEATADGPIDEGEEGRSSPTSNSSSSSPSRSKSGRETKHPARGRRCVHSSRSNTSGSAEPRMGRRTPPAGMDDTSALAVGVDEAGSSVIAAARPLSTARRRAAWHSLNTHTWPLTSARRPVLPARRNTRQSSSVPSLPGDGPCTSSCSSLALATASSLKSM